MKWLPLWLVDKILLLLAWLALGNIEKYGLRRPSKGPLELKNAEGKTPVLDTGALGKIRSGDIKVVPGIKRFSPGRVELVDGQVLDIDSVILATGYRSNVPQWLQVQTSIRFSAGWSLICIKWGLICACLIYRAAISSPKTDFRRLHSQMGGRGSPDSTRWGSRNGVSPGPPRTR